MASNRKLNRSNPHTGLPWGPDAGNVIDLSQTGEGDAVLRTRVEVLGHAVLGGGLSDLAERYPDQIDLPEGVPVTPEEPAAPAFDPSVYKKDPFQ